MKILITGSTGRLGKEMVKVFLRCLKPTEQELDVVDKDKVFSYIKLHRPKIVIHLAALVGIRECENEKQIAWEINVEGTKNIIKACEKFVPDCYFIYISSPCVFSGDEGNYTEKSLPYPKNFYGITKMVAEILVLNSVIHKTLVVRTNFSPKEKWRYKKAFIDRFGNYLFSDDVAKALKEVIEKRVQGILHIIGEKKISMFELAKMTTRLEPLTLAEYNGPPLTIDMSMDTIYPEWKKFKISKVKK